MRLKLNPLYRRLRLALLKTSPKFQPWTGVVFRSVTLEYAKPELVVSGKGAAKTGGRWNPPGQFEALYCSLRPGTAIEEAMRLFESVGLSNPSKATTGRRDSICSPQGSKSSARYGMGRHKNVSIAS